MSLDAVLAEARAAKSAGASRFCMGAAWREPKDRDLEQVCAMVEGVRALGLESCATLGMLTATQARAPEGVRPRLLQPQPRHLAGILRRDHHHARLSGSPRYAQRGAQRRHQRVLRRHRRHGRERRRPRRAHCGAGEPAAASGVGADQHAGAGRGYAVVRQCGARSARLRAHHRGRAHHHAEVDGAALRRARGHERRDPGAVLSRRRQFDLLRAEAADDAQSGPRSRHAAARPPRPRPME